ncbi:hypothetical protein [Teichococcus deserti]|nr:hypothetical protein [Pseudoroseomonas deserti]
MIGPSEVTAFTLRQRLHPGNGQRLHDLAKRCDEEIASPPVLRHRC